jgi:hypothetical protein
MDNKYKILYIVEEKEEYFIIMTGGWILKEYDDHIKGWSDCKFNTHEEAQNLIDRLNNGECEFEDNYIGFIDNKIYYPVNPTPAKSYVESN